MGLNPAPEPIEISPIKLIVMSLIFALVFFILGILTMHYPKITGVI